MIAGLEPILAPLADIVRRALLRIRLADRRWALSEIHPMNPDRHELEKQAILLENALWR